MMFEFIAFNSEEASDAINKAVCELAPGKKMKPPKKAGFRKKDAFICDSEKEAVNAVLGFMEQDYQDSVNDGLDHQVSFCVNGDELYFGDDVFAILNRVSAKDTDEGGVVYAIYFQSFADKYAIWLP